MHETRKLKQDQMRVSSFEFSDKASGEENRPVDQNSGLIFQTECLPVSASIYLWKTQKIWRRSESKVQDNMIQVFISTLLHCLKDNQKTHSDLCFCYLIPIFISARPRYDRRIIRHADSRQPVAEPSCPDSIWGEHQWLEPLCLGAQKSIFSH